MRMSRESRAAGYELPLDESNPATVVRLWRV
jgi:hypothetical protein